MDDHNHTSSPQAESQALPADPARRRFLQGTLASTAALGSLGAASLAQAQTELKRRTINHYHIPATDQTVHWGYFSKSLTPLDVCFVSPAPGKRHARVGGHPVPWRAFPGFPLARE